MLQHSLSSVEQLVLVLVLVIVHAVKKIPEVMKGNCLNSHLIVKKRALKGPMM